MYVCKECKNKDTLVQSMQDDLPEEFICNECGKPMKRDILGENKTTSIHIPDHMTATEVNKPQYTYDKSPSQKKHFW